MSLYFKIFTFPFNIIKIVVLKNNKIEIIIFIKIYGSVIQFHFVFNKNNIKTKTFTKIKGKLSEISFTTVLFFLIQNSLL